MPPCLMHIHYSIYCLYFSEGALTTIYQSKCLCLCSGLCNTYSMLYVQIKSWSTECTILSCTAYCTEQVWSSYVLLVFYVYSSLLIFIPGPKYISCPVKNAIYYFPFYTFISFKLNKLTYNFRKCIFHPASHSPFIQICKS